MQVPILVGIPKRHNSSYKNGHILRKNVLLKPNFQDEAHLGANFLIFILTIYSDRVSFQFFSRGLRLPTGILTVSKWTEKSL